MSKSRFKQLSDLLSGKMPDGKAALETDDIDRRHAVHELIAARVQAGIEAPGQETHWRYLIQFRKHSPWHQRQYITSELAKREDRMLLGRSQILLMTPSCPDSEEANALLCLASWEKWMRENASLRRLLRDTISKPNYGGIQPDRKTIIERVFGRPNTGGTMKMQQERREALTYLLRARVQAGIRANPELQWRWEKLDLGSITGLGMQELREGERIVLYPGMRGYGMFISFLALPAL